MSKVAIEVDRAWLELLEVACCHHARYVTSEIYCIGNDRSRIDSNNREKSCENKMQNVVPFDIMFKKDE